MQAPTLHFRLQGDAKLRAVYLNGEALSPDDSREVFDHSPDGFNWGYSGSGPMQLALAICIKLFENFKGYKEFCNLYLARLTRDKDFDVRFDVSEWYYSHYCEIPWARLKSGIYVANYSSPHTFTFQDGTVLGACDDERAKAPIISMQDEVVDNYSRIMGDSMVEIEYVRPTITLTEYGAKDLDRYSAIFGGEIVIVPRPVLEAYRDNTDYINYMASPFVTGRLYDRVKKILHVDKFCK